MKLSVVIPTYNRADILKQCLQALEKQTLSKEKFEVVIVDDGSIDSTAKVVSGFSEKSEMDILYIHQENKGQGIARNNGIGEAKGEVIVLIGDDIIVNKEFLEEHYKVHKAHPENRYACLGFIDWHPEIEVNAVMKWLTNGSAIFGKFGGHQFAFEKLEGEDFADYNFFYTSNISIKRGLLLVEPFDDSFSSYGWEDIELGYRLTKKHNLKLVYNPKAVGYHHHVITLDSMKRRMIMIGKGTHLIDSLHPELHKRPSFLKGIIFTILGFPLVIGIFKMMEFHNLYYYAISKRHFMKGYREGK